MKGDALYLRHILESIGRIERYTAEGRTYFLADEKTQDAVLHNLQTLSESTQRLSDDLKSQHAEIDWRSIAAFPNVVTHNYLGIDLEQIWAIVEHDLPELRRVVQQIRPLR